MTNFDEIRDLISSDLERLQKIIKQSLSSNSPLLNKIVDKYLETKGKQIRPIIVVLSAKFFGAEVSDGVLCGAASVELLHNASLIHDDVIDETKQRRGHDTINNTWDNHIAVLVGDFFVSNALACAIRTNDFRVISTISELGKELSTGEIDQIDVAKHHSIDEQTYFSIINKKTASLFQSCVKVGGYSVGASDIDIANLSKFVELLGLSFQIKDDIFDYFKDDAIGKPTGNDLREGKVTLPLIYALSRTESPRHGEMRRLADSDSLTTEQIETLIDFAKAEGGIEYAYATMERLRAEARSILEPYPDNEAKRAFLSLFDYIIKRHH
ncbi:MAG: polyprenyl synthetase family protein [Prevotella sp.]|jgi:octaprenyl-diphosphate synthase|uniref:polyprenyl synthetase family protein n=1 Tax=Candidatus Limisoma sp. TaxID=3076476 RepID=UPI003FF03459|nr:polyprenyl synthetase family protein [Prevotella sp.]MBS7207243.1 polyprenyl synthetase family protein [Prevotella sp.]UKI24300.1 MAG: polyprenyl synthetase family protein [Bacteroidales bacterium]